MKLLQTMINHKINRIRPNDLLSIASQYNVKLGNEQAAKITTLLAGQNRDIFDPVQRNRVLNEIAAITDPATARQIATIFDQLTGSV